MFQTLVVDISIIFHINQQNTVKEKKITSVLEQNKRPSTYVRILKFFLFQITSITETC